MDLDTGKVSPEHWMRPASGRLLAWLICWVSLPPVSLQPTIHILFITLEAAFSYIFWAIRTFNMDYGMSQICLWDRNTLEYDRCCSHCCLNETISGDFKLSAQQLEGQTAQRQENHRTSNKASESKIRKSKTYYCALCKASKVSQYRLTEHNKTPSPLRKAADLADPTNPTNALFVTLLTRKSTT
jgi:hypothetical protein